MMWKRKPSTTLLCWGGGAERNWASQVALVVNNPPANAGRYKKCRLDPWVGEIPWHRGHGNSTLVSLPREPHGQRSLVGYSP